MADLNRARDITIIDLREITPVFDYFVLATGSSRRQLHAIAEEVDDVLKKEFGDRRLGIEGYVDSRWILLDFGDVVVHLFDDETRQYYDLEHLWAGAKRIEYVSPDLPAVGQPAAQAVSKEMAVDESADDESADEDVADEDSADES